MKRVLARYAIVELLIGAGLGPILNIVSRRHGRILVSYGTRRVVASASMVRGQRQLVDPP